MAIYCPVCASPVNETQEFCRECGGSLWDYPPRRGIQSPIVGVLLAFGGLIIALAGRMVLNETLIVFLGVVTSLIGMISIAIIPLAAAKSERARKRREPVFVPAAVHPTTQLPPAAARVDFASVAEDTTELLKTRIERNE